MEQHKIIWRGIEIEITFTPEKFGIIDHIELRTQNKTPLPVTETGYRSHFIQAGTVLHFGGAIAFVTAWLDHEAGCAAWNSTILAVSSTVIAILLSLLAAYGFARYAFAWRHILLLFILIPKLIPRVSLIVPLYDLVQGIGMLDTRIALIVVYAASAVPLATWILIGFVAAVPKDIDEAARMDGAGTLTIIFRFIVPLAIPGLLTVTVLSLRDSWNEFAYVLALSSSDDIRTLPYQLFLLGDTFGLADQGLIQAFALLSIIPLLLVYLWLEKYVVQGLTQGAVK